MAERSASDPGLNMKRVSKRDLSLASAASARFKSMTVSLRGELMSSTSNSGLVDFAVGMPRADIRGGARTMVKAQSRKRSGVRNRPISRHGQNGVLHHILGHIRPRDVEPHQARMQEPESAVQKASTGFSDSSCRKASGQIGRFVVHVCSLPLLHDC